MHVTAVVVTYERKALLRQCLTALQEQTRPVDAIVVVDNASTDGTAAMVRSEFPAVTLRRLDENRGGAGGFHEGMRVAAEQETDWIWVMDDDVEPAPDALDALVESDLATRDDTVALASRKIGPDGAVQHGHAGFYDPVTAAKSAVSAASHAQPIGFSSFVGLLVRRTAVATVGLPERGMFIWGDDVEFSLRLAAAGRLYLVPQSRLVHHDAFARDRKQAVIGSRAWRNRPIEEFWRKYYEIRNPLLILHRHVDHPAQRGCGIGRAIGRVVRAALAILVVDDRRGLRLRLLRDAFVHGVRGYTGPYVRPDDFPDRTHPEALRPQTALTSW